MLNISPSIASANQINLETTVRRLENMKIDNLHIDIEDGNFIPNITFGLRTIEDLREITNIPFSVHIMGYHPENYLHDLAEIGVDSITVNIEACNYPRKILNMIKSLNIRAGFAINPKTPIEQILYMKDDIDIIVIMTAEPDCCGQLFIREMLNKVEKLSRINHRKFKIWTDGGISKAELSDIYNAGADTVVLGREVFKNGKIEENIKSINKVLSDL